MALINRRFIELALLACAAYLPAAEAATYFSRANGDWDQTDRWSTVGCGGASAGAVPGPADDAVICNHTIDLDAGSGSRTVLSLRIQNGGTLRFAGGSVSLTVTAAVPATTNSLQVDAGGTVTVSTNGTYPINLARDLSNAGTLNCVSTAARLCNITFNGSVAQAFGGGGTTTFNAVTLNNAAGVTFNQSATINAALTFTNGRLATGANVVTIAQAGSVAGAAANRYVIGNLSRYVATGAPTVVYDVGGAAANAYTPVSVAFTGVSTAGFYQVSTTDGEHPQVASSGLDGARSVNRYWTLANVSVVFSTTMGALGYASPTFNFLAGDLDGGADTASLELARRAGGTWYVADPGTRAAASTQALYVTNAGEFAIGNYAASTRVAEYRMDVCSGAAASGTDSGPNGLNGTVVGGVTLLNPGRLCTGSSFNGSTGYINVPDNAPMDALTQRIAVAAWVRASGARKNWEAIVTKGDSAFRMHLGGGCTMGNQFNNFATLHAFHFGKNGGCADADLSSGIVPVNGTWYHVVGTYDNNRIRIYVDGVLRNWADLATAINTNNFDFRIGENAQQTGRHWTGDIDEVVLWNRAVTPSELIDHRDQARSCCIDHLSITHAGTGVACAEQTITLSAHSASHAVVSANGLAVSLSTGNGKGTWTGIVAGGGSLTGVTAGAGTATYTFAPGSGTVDLSFRYADLAASSESFNFLASGGGYSNTSGGAIAADNPSFTMAQAGFRLRNATDGNTTIVTQISGKPSNTGWNAKTVNLQAIRTDTATGSCVGLFASQSRTVELGAECNSPASCAGLQVAVNGNNIATSADNGGAGAAAYTGVSLAFDANSEAATVINYPDAGRISLHARYDLDAGVAGFEMSGSSNAFVVRPFGLAIRGANAAAPIAHSSTDAGAVLAAAGDNFTMTVAAYRWAAGQDADNDGVPDSGVNITANGLTPNFAAAASVSAVSNLPGIATGTITRGVNCASAGTVAAGSWSGGAASITDWCYSEAGNVLLGAASDDYLGAADADIAGSSGFDGTGPAGGHVGRFRPRHFAVSAATLATRHGAACAPASSFTYLDEPLRLTYTLAAQNAQNATTQNYSGSYAKLGLTTFANWSLGARSGTTDLSARLDTGTAPTGSWVNGVASGIVLTTAVNRATPDNPDGPFSATAFGIAPVDADGVAMNTLDLDVDNNAVMDRKNLGVSGEFRFGRLRLLNAAGSLTTVLPVPFRTEFWNGSAFALNTQDSCTTVARNTVAMSFTPPSNLVACETAFTAASATMASGLATLYLAAPGAGNTGSVLLTPQLNPAAAGTFCATVGGASAAATTANQAYLTGRWNDAADPDADPNTSHDDNPSGRASFGIYGSQPNNYIYFRENF